MKPLDPGRFLAQTLRPFTVGDRSGLPDLFERYLLEPSDTDDAAIAARLADVKALWSKGVEHPRYGTLVKSLLAAHGEAELTLLDPSERASLAREAEESAQRERKNAEAALRQWRGVLAERVAGGGLTPNLRAQLEKLGEGMGVDPTVLQRELDAAPVATPPKLLPDDVRRQIGSLLSEHAREAKEERVGLSLFHALGLEGITEDVAAIQQRYEAMSAETSRSAIGQAATIAKNVLANVKLYLLDADPRAYIESLVSDVTEKMAVEGALAAADSTIDPVEAESLKQSAMRLGLTADLARRVITEIARDNGATIEATGSVDYVSCPVCNSPHPRPSAPDACKRCGTALFIVCPADGCGARNDATALRCYVCQADLHRYAEATRRLQRIGPAADDGRLAWAASEIREITAVLGADSVPAELRQRVERRLAEAQAEWHGIEEAVAARRLFAARGALRRMASKAVDVPNSAGDAPATQLAEVERRIDEAQALLEEARTATGAARESALVRAVGTAADFDEAVRALGAIPPEPPGIPSAQLQDAGVVVEWQPSVTHGAQYELRRIDANTNAVDELGATTGTRFDDRGAPSGALVRYEVATVRGQARSQTVRSGVVLVAREAGDVRVAELDGEIRLSWGSLPASARALVRRTAPDGVVTELDADRTGLVDREVENGRRYAYEVAVEYVAPGGPRQRTAGATVYGQPAAPPEGLEELRIREVGGTLTIEYDRPPAGAVRVLRCDDEPALGLGEPVDPARLADLGTVLPDGPDGARDSTPTGLCWYLPITVAGGVAVAGRAVRHLALPTIANVRAEETAGSVRVTWTWPDNVRVARVIWRLDREPQGPDEPGVVAAWVRLGEYRDHGGFTIERPDASPVFVAVVPAIRADGELVAGTAIARGSRAAVRPTMKTDLRYAISVRRAGLRSRRLEVEVVVPEGATAPRLALVARPGDLLPRQLQDGDVVARLGGADALSSSVDLDGRSRPLAVRLFLESSSAASRYRLFDPPADDLLIR